jgi:copper homeostasis protein
VWKGVRLEVIVQTVSDAVAAAEGGADRLEVVREIVQGGLTPATETVRAIQRATALPLRVMVRENAGFTLEASELDACRRAIEDFAALDVDGIVLGFAARGVARLDDVTRVLEAGPPVRVTFHRAFDQLADPLAALPQIAAVPNVDRVLTSGGKGPTAVRAARLAAYVSAAAGLIILAGGGVDDGMVAHLARDAIVPEVHVGRAARGDGTSDGAVAAARVRELRRLAEGHHRLPAPARA